jgi:hypothetical protein
MMLVNRHGSIKDAQAGLAHGRMGTLGHFRGIFPMDEGIGPVPFSHVFNPYGYEYATELHRLR